MFDKLNESSLEVQSLTQSLFWFKKNKVINFADFTNPTKAMELKYDQNFRTSLTWKDAVEIHIFEPLNENYSWKVENWNECRGSISLESESVKPAIDKKKDKRVYTVMKDYNLIPGANFGLTKDQIADNIGIHKFILRVKGKDD